MHHVFLHYINFFFELPCTIYGIQLITVSLFYFSSLPTIIIIFVLVSNTAIDFAAEENRFFRTLTQTSFLSPFVHSFLSSFTFNDRISFYYFIDSIAFKI